MSTPLVPEPRIDKEYMDFVDSHSEHSFGSGRIEAYAEPKGWLTRLLWPLLQVRTGLIWTKQPSVGEVRIEVTGAGEGGGR